MEVIETAEEMQAWAMRQRGRGQLLGFVPTMGALHEGHLSLIDIARDRADLAIVSIFVNPTQFGPNEDFDKYPRQRQEDLEKCKKRGAAVIFAPRREEIYPPGFSTYVLEEELSKGLEGISRPVHFRGVTTVVNILFNICRPDVAVFGQKDAQQAAIIRKMVRDLHLPVDIIVGQTTREPDGLAMSSRNRYLEPHERADAAKLYAALKAGKALAEQGYSSVERIRAEVTHQLAHCRRIRIIYIEIVDKETMKPEKTVRPGRSLICAAVWLEQIRLIDNIEM